MIQSFPYYTYHDVTKILAIQSYPITITILFVITTSVTVVTTANFSSSAIVQPKIYLKILTPGY